MAKVSSSSALPQFISDLLSKHKTLAAEIEWIEATLGRVTNALGVTSAPAAKATASKAKRTAKKVAKKPAVKLAAAPVANKPAATTAPKAPAKAPAKSGLTAHEFVLAFVKSKKNPTTQDVNKHWKSSGRLGNADNTMSQLTKLKKLKRTPLTGGQRGSTYAAI